MVNLSSARRALSRTGNSSTRRAGSAGLGAAGLGAAVGAVAAVGVLAGRKAAATAKVGQGHPLKHRVLDLASGFAQPKYPLAIAGEEIRIRLTAGKPGNADETSDQGTVRIR